jgi:hypothetical protein
MHECSTKKTIILKASREYASQSEASEGEESDQEDEVEVTEGDLLMIRRLLGKSIKSSQ